MTGRDPAVEAAQRAYLQWAPRNAQPTPMMLDAAREALAPYRDRHRPFIRDYPGGDGRTVCRHCLGPIDWPCPDARDAHPESEL